jgi:hypothetical protein
MLRNLRGAVLVASAAGLGLAWAQFPAPVSPQAPIGGQIGDIDRDHGDEPYLTRELQQRQLKRLREQHQHEVLTDTARMVQLAAALKDEVDKGNKATLNADVMKDADEIGKLAKRVSDRIKTQ